MSKLDNFIMKNNISTPIKKVEEDIDETKKKVTMKKKIVTATTDLVEEITPVFLIEDGRQLLI